MIKTNGKTPLSTLGADLINERKRRIKSGTDQRFVRTAPGTWGLAEWGFTHVETIPKKGSKKNTSKK
jgi:hypothetical protein